MPAPPLEGLNLNLLVTLRALLREESVTRAAHALGATQPTVSRALATLRQAFDDPLLVRVGRGMVLTPTARALIAPLDRALAALDRLKALGRFDPQAARRRFRVVMPDAVGCGVMPALAVAISATAGLSLELLGVEGEGIGALLGGDTDLVIGATRVEHADLYTRAAPSEVGMSVLLGPLHPSYAAPLTYEGWLTSKHAQLLPVGRPHLNSALDAQLEARGERRDVRARVAYLSGLAELLEATPLVASLPTPTARWLARDRALRVHPHPLKAPSGFKAWMTWHRVNHEDEGHRWLRGEAMRCLEAFWRG